MCGIAGICSNVASLTGRDRLQQMADSLRHRGPDGEGFYQGCHTDKHIGLAHRRLAITDPGEANAQPFRYLNRYVVVHNGEIYNHAEIRRELERQGYRFSTRGDTEVIAAAYAARGAECLQWFDGMFAFAIWDEADGTLYCARDRFGEKPFYYHWDAVTLTFSFASEMKALWAAGIPRNIQPGMFLHFLTLGQTFHPDLPELSFYRDIFQLPPAHSLTLRPGMDGFELASYWDIDKENIRDIGDDEAVREFRRLMEKGLSRRMPCDRTMGIMVSGGIDSTALLGAMEGLTIIPPADSENKEQPSVSDERAVTIKGDNGPHLNDNGMASPGPGNTDGSDNENLALDSPHDSVSAVFPGFQKDESQAIRQVNHRFKLRQHLVEASGESLADSMEKLAWHQEEPFSSASVWAQHTVYGYAKKTGLTVMMDGQGADELLGGYERHIPWYLREPSAPGPAGKRTQETRLGQKPGTREAKAFLENGFQFSWDYQARVSAYFPGLTTAFLESRARRAHASHPFIHPRFLEENSGAGFIRKPLVRRLNDILYHDSLQGPLQELLRYADRNSMAHGVEARMPFLFHEMAEFVFALPATLKMRDGWTKWILRESYRSAIPEEIMHRKGKTGFEPPQQAWMSLPAAQESIRQARQKLVDAGMLKPAILKTSVQPSAAYERHPYDWRIWVAAQFI